MTMTKVLCIQISTCSQGAKLKSFEQKNSNKKCYFVLKCKRTIKDSKMLKDNLLKSI